MRMIFWALLILIACGVGSVLAGFLVGLYQKRQALRQVMKSVWRREDVQASRDRCEPSFSTVRHISNPPAGVDASAILALLRARQQHARSQMQFNPSLQRVLEIDARFQLYRSQQRAASTDILGGAGGFHAHGVLWSILGGLR